MALRSWRWHVVPHSEFLQRSIGRRKLRRLPRLHMPLSSQIVRFKITRRPKRRWFT